jgi:hypothetical protein
MLLTISTTNQPATDLGYLLHKNPARLQTEELSFGKVYVFYPDASVDLCTAALLIEIDPVALVRGRGSYCGTPWGYKCPKRNADWPGSEILRTSTKP